VSRRLTRPLAVALLATLALTAAGCTATGGAPTASPTATADAQTREQTAAAIGDSIAIGYGVPADDAWPLLVARRVGWNLTDLADAGSGFTRRGGSSHLFDDQISAVIRLHPDIVLLAATRNDVDAPVAAMQAATTAGVQRLRAALPHARIIGVGPIWGADEPTAAVAAVDAAARSAVLGVRGSWVEIGQPLTGHPELLQPDGKHPTVEGQQAIAKAVAAKVATLLARGS